MQFNKLCEDEGVDHQLTVDYTPQHNGVSETKNLIAINMAKSMLVEKKAFEEVVEVVFSLVYLQNWGLTKTIYNMTLFEAWLVHNPSVKNFKIFDNLCYYPILDQKRSKLNVKAK